jgi:hypothetical protein
LAKLLGIPEHALLRMETDGRIPGCVMLAFIDVTGPNPAWLLSETGELYLRLAPADLARGTGTNDCPNLDTR